MRRLSEFYNDNIILKRLCGVLFLVIIFLGMFTGCRSTYYYRRRAAEKARDYALDQLRELSEVKRNYIRYTPPYFLDNRLFVREGKRFSSKKDIMQTCAVWDVPGLEDSIVVVGVSERNLFDWYPVRVVRKKFKRANKKQLDAQNDAVRYAMNHMLFLSNSSRNRIRFSNPDVFRTGFNLTPDELPKKKFKHATQVSFVWKADEADQRLVVIGISEPNMSSWKPVKAVMMDALLVDHYKDRQESMK